MVVEFYKTCHVEFCYIFFIHWKNFCFNCNGTLFSLQIHGHSECRGNHQDNKHLTYRSIHTAKQDLKNNKLKHTSL